MAEKKRGLPSSFQLDVSRAAIEGPAQPGDYLDEESAPPAVRTIPPSSNVVEMPHRGGPQESGPTHVPLPVQPTHMRLKAPIPKPTRLPTSVPRKQVNMTPETLRMVEELLDYVRTYSVQKDTKASELFHALVLAVYEAREYIDLSHVQPRGRWGMPTAAAFPIAIKTAIQAAITEWNRRK